MCTGGTFISTLNSSKTMNCVYSSGRSGPNKKNIATSTAADLTLGMRNRLMNAQLDNLNVKDLAKLCDFLPKALDYLKKNPNMAEYIAHYVMGKSIDNTAFPKDLKTADFEDACDVFDQTLTTRNSQRILHDLLSTHRYGFFGRAEATDKTIAKLSLLSEELKNVQQPILIQSHHFPNKASSNNNKQSCTMESKPETKTKLNALSVKTPSDKQMDKLITTLMHKESESVESVVIAARSSGISKVEDFIKFASKWAALFDNSGPMGGYPPHLYSPSEFGEFAKEAKITNTEDLITLAKAITKPKRSYYDNSTGEEVYKLHIENQGGLIYKRDYVQFAKSAGIEDINKFMNALGFVGYSAI